ncbi:MAG TPA: GNA1162 family protein [Bdellovibrionota bacterium]|nr:GNA1162 family protein [Bdellovibrionota bacterium]
MRKPPMNTILPAIFLCAGVVLTSSCAKTIQIETRAPAASSKGIQKIAVFPLTNYSTTKDAGKIVGSMLAGDWKGRNPGQEVVDVETAARFLGEKHVRVPETIDRVKAVELGSILGVDAILAGSVLEYGTVSRARRKVIVQEPVIGIEVILVRVKDGLVLWNGFHARTSDSLTVPSRDTPESVAAQAVSELVGNYLSRDTNAKD